MDVPADTAWLLRNRFNPFGVPGTVALVDGTISFTLSGEAAADASLGWIEEKLGLEGLDERLSAGEKVEVFSHPLGECEVAWPLTGGGMMMIVQAPGEESWVVSHDHLPAPAGRVLATFHLSSGRGRVKAWKQALAAAERGPAAEENED